MCLLVVVVKQVNGLLVNAMFSSIIIVIERTYGFVFEGYILLHYFGYMPAWFIVKAMFSFINVLATEAKWHMFDLLCIDFLISDELVTS